MQNQTITSSQKLNQAKERLKNALSSLENAITRQNQTIESEARIRSEVIKNIDMYIGSLQAILEKSG